MTGGTSDCSDSRSSTNKGPKYLQYSNSLNETFIVVFYTAVLSYVLNVKTFLAFIYSNRSLCFFSCNLFFCSSPGGVVLEALTWRFRMATYSG